MTTEDDFQAMLAADPNDHATRLILADFLDERGDPRGPGYRALAILRRLPVQPDRPSRFIYPGYCNTRGARSVDGKDARAEAALAVLPKDWLTATQKRLGATDPLQDERWACADTRRAIEDVAAGAFADLTPARRTRLLRPPAEPKKRARSGRRASTSGAAPAARRKRGTT
jgi:uncharacterized protein (TIGR02996 family)